LRGVPTVSNYGKSSSVPVTPASMQEQRKLPSEWKPAEAPPEPDPNEKIVEQLYKIKSKCRCSLTLWIIVPD